MIPRRSLSAALLLVAVACGKEASAPDPEVQPMARIELDSNRTIEVVGLRRWTTDMLRD